MSFNFSRENVKEQGGVAIFNGGVAGRVTGVTVTVKKKGVDYQDDGKNKPDYQIVYTDANGQSTNEGFYYLNEKTYDAKYSPFEKAVEKQWNKFANIINAANGDPTISPTEDAKSVLDQMAVLTKNVVVGKTFNVFTNYGTKQNPKKFLQIRSWVPFIEASDVSESDTKLKASNLDQIERPEVPQDGASSSVGTSPAADGWV